MYIGHHLCLRLDVEKVLHIHKDKLDSEIVIEFTMKEDLPNASCSKYYRYEDRLQVCCRFSTRKQRHHGSHDEDRRMSNDIYEIGARHWNFSLIEKNRKPGDL